MSAKRPLRASKSVGFISALLLSTAITAPAMAQIEEVIVTAQKRTEDVQTVPIAITAFSSQDLKAHQVIQFKDLQFSTPNVTYTKGNFTGSDFQIRGIGITAIGFDAESGVAINFNDVFLAAPNVADNAFFDLERIEVLRGPQSTLYGRGATGGVVSVVAAKPQLDAFGSNLEFTYGNFDQREIKGMVNVPIVTDELAVRIAGDWIKHSGFVTNTFNNTHPDDRSQYSVRGSLRWEPTDKTTLDITAAFSKEVDNKMRSQKQLCHTDPTGVLGCLPDSSPVGLVNTNATLGTIASSDQGLASAFGPGLGAALGLFNLTVPPALPPGIANPQDVRTIFSSFNPTYRTSDNFLSAEWKQSWTGWLESTFVGGYDHATLVSQESFNNIPGTTVDPTQLAIAEGTFLGTIGFLGGPGYAAHFAPFFAVPGTLPLSNGPAKLGVIGRDFTTTKEIAAFDQSNGESTQWSIEGRFNTKFEGPLNFMVAGYYLQQHSNGDYFVFAPTLDYPAIVLGGFSGLSPALAPLCFSTGCILGPSYFHSDGDFINLKSQAIFGEAYYTAIPDTLTLTLGLRWTEDTKFQRNRTTLFSGFVPIGSTNEKAALAALAAQGQVDFDASNGTPPFDVWQINRKIFRKWTGRAVANWTPKVDFTDATLIYASFARGYKAGGFNPGIQPGLGVPLTYGPEQIDAYEVGTKNSLLDRTLQANANFWYYDYTGLQVSKIVNNTSVNENIDAKLYGVEGSFIWVPDEHWQFNLNLSHTNTSIGGSTSVDPRNPSNGYGKALLVKDASLSATVGQNCVLYYNGATPGTLPVLPPGLPGFFAPPGGVGALSGVGIPFSAYGNCLSPNRVIAPGVTYGNVLAAQGFSTTDPAVNGTYDGVPANLKDNRLQNTPDNTISVGAQYTQPLGDDYNLVGRVDFYWQGDMFGRIFNGPADKIDSWNVTNLSLTLNAPDDLWYVQGFVKNVGDNNNLTGMFVQSATSGLFTNAFFIDPRTYGVRVGLHI